LIFAQNPLNNKKNLPVKAVFMFSSGCISYQILNRNINKTCNIYFIMSSDVGHPDFIFEKIHEVSTKFD
jgi:hypothetical protein